MNEPHMSNLLFTESSSVSRTPKLVYHSNSPTGRPYSAPPLDTGPTRSTKTTSWMGTPSDRLSEVWAECCPPRTGMPYHGTLGNSNTTKTLSHTFLNPSRIGTMLHGPIPREGRYPNPASPGMKTKGRSNMDLCCDRQRARTPTGIRRVASLLEGKDTRSSARWSPAQIELMVMDKIRAHTSGRGSGFSFEAFRLFKPPKSDQISPEQFKSSLERLLCTEFSEEESRGLFDTYDGDGSGSLDIQEFVQALLAPPDRPKTLCDTRSMVFSKSPGVKKTQVFLPVDLTRGQEAPLHARIQRTWVPSKWFKPSGLKR